MTAPPGGKPSGRAASQQFCFDGWMDELRFYEGYLTDNELAAVYNACLQAPPTPEPLSLKIAQSTNVVLWWPVTETALALQSRPDLSSTSRWSLVTNSPVPGETNNLSRCQTPRKWLCFASARSLMPAR